MKRTALLLLVTLAFAQKPEHAPLPETSNLKLVSAYQSAVISYQALQAAQQAVATNQAAYDRDVASFHTLEASEAKANGYPEGTTFTVDTNKRLATANVPAKKEAEKK